MYGRFAFISNSNALANTANVEQTGLLNTSLIVQSGTANDCTVIQSSNGNSLRPLFPSLRERKGPLRFMA